MQDITCRANVLRIWDQEMREQHIGPRLETLQPTSLDQLAPDLTETRSGFVITESVTRDEAKSYIDVARTVTVTALEAEIRRPAYGEGMKICLHQRERSGCNLGQNVNRREGCWISHQRQLQHILDRAAPELRPDPIVFTSHLLVCRMRRPIDTLTPEIVERDGNGAAALTQGEVQIDVQAGDRGAFHGICSAGGKPFQPLVSGAHRPGDKLALGPEQPQFEGQLVAAFPGVFR